MTRTEAPGTGAGEGPGWGRPETVCSPYSSHPVLGLALLQGGDVLTLSQPLGHLSEVEMAQRVHQNSVW